LLTLNLHANTPDLAINTYELGREYLNFALKKNPDPTLNVFRENDSIGNSLVFDYREYSWFSINALQFLKVAYNLREQFKDLHKMHIIEIGGGYGEQCKILADLTGFASYTIIDSSENLNLAKKHLMGIPNVYFIENTKQIGSYDLVISNYAFSRLDYTEYLDCVISPTKNGYMIEDLPIDELVRLLHSKNRKGKVKEGPDYFIITWKPNEASVVNKKKDALFPELKSETAISYSLSGGRLGDNLIAYFHAKWLAYKYNLPLRYISFPFADQFCLFEKDQPLDSINFQNSITTTSEADIKTAPSSSLFIIPYFSENTEYIYNNKVDPPFQIDWEDPEFHSQVVECLTPKKPIQNSPMPKNKITVGVHVRKGGGKDKSFMNKELPLKFPPDSYYIQQIERIAEIFKEHSLYVYILTDDKKPINIVKKYQKAINNPRICFDYRRTKNGPSINILEDFFLISQFDCLVIPQSNFSLMASKIADHDLIITPIHPLFVDDRVIIDEIEIAFNSKRLSKKKLKTNNRSLFKLIVDFF
jgi:hypothetical protein